MRIGRTGICAAGHRKGVVEWLAASGGKLRGIVLGKVL